ncbi:DUF4091 domain-containing protein [Paenibacillus antri]|uniref:DUF4091 domain-containing protein n=1 Tax=Paenibacillus antri TaxID=2582848 RepID=A0A5R9GKV1_9BACL|nr:DUF4091 domain-containing protein [Paenibacillus antri]TLS54274.1 DUF4091 domain-containing protein [Paenibacillus antri]
MFETRCLSSLSKVFADEALTDAPVREGSALWGETFSFQVAYRSETLLPALRIRAASPLEPYIAVRAVGLSPSDLPAYSNPDEGYLRTTPGLYPDPLFPAGDDLRALPKQWRSLWVTVTLPALAEAEASALAGNGPEAAFPIEIVLTDAEGGELGAERFELTVVRAELPEQRLLHTEWFHADCIATRYGVEAFDEAHWRLLETYLANAYSHGINMILTPLFTPPLDTAIGGERPTMQLVGVEETGDGEYRFDFARLDRWVATCHRVGIRHFEMSHLFTQWGAKHAPKIVAVRDGVEKRIFGWDTEAAGEAYGRFLDQFLPALVAYLKENGLEKNVYFHVSDEPIPDNLEFYRAAKQVLMRHLDGFAFFEALSDYSFYEQGLVPIPVPANNHIEPFLAAGVEPLWTYYCCSQNRDGVANRFFAMPSSRNRVLGVQLYKFRIAGFLQWGYNFWYSQYSKREIDPFRVTDAGGAFPSGDAFVVYPGADGPIDSIRWEVFREALQDLRALELLESRIGRDAALAIAEEELGGEEGISFRMGAPDPARLLRARQRVNGAIASSYATVK